MKTSKHRALFDKVFRHIVTGDQVEKSKPSPDIFQAAFKKFVFGNEDVGVVECLVFEDAPLGVQAALAAFLKTVLVTRQEMQDDLKPHENMTNLFYFMPEMWGLPWFFLNTYLSSLLFVVSKTHLSTFFCI
jgi:beta-phosphoglucomutase-like phosphatase (HAD superfamily)